jgi:cytoskeletal protein RodZ
LGASTRVAERLSIKLSYILQREKQDAAEVPNNIFVLALTAEF